jgi:predicted DNA-binding transcriptional regulator AlpA
MEDKLYDTGAMAAYLGVSVMMAHKMRIQGTGPRYIKLGPKLVRYRREDLDEWIAQCSRTSTSQAAPARAKAGAA